MQRVLKLKLKNMNKKQVAKAYIEAAEAAIEYSKKKGVGKVKFCKYILNKNLHNGIC